jgi:hypothetical protein
MNGEEKETKGMSKNKGEKVAVTVIKSSQSVAIVDAGWVG